jgi:hypothetical protein
MTQFLFAVLQAVELGFGESPPALNIPTNAIRTTRVAFAHDADGAGALEALRAGSHGGMTEGFDLGGKTAELRGFVNSLRHG